MSFWSVLSDAVQHRGSMAAAAADLGKGEGLMGYELEAGSVHLPGAIHVLGLQLLKKSVVDPQVDIALPVALFWGRRHISNGPLIHLQR